MTTVDAAVPQFEHYAVRRKLGGGATGTVYEAFDRTRNAVVALKTLHAASSSALYRLKQEFRALTDVSHPNLVALYELVGGDDGWFIVMERVEGVGFMEHVRGRGYRGGTTGSMHTPRSWVSSELSHGDAPGGTVTTGDEPARLCPDLERLRGALIQLLAAVGYLHAAGILHRDIKPSNVLVDADGRVVLLDFGLAYDTERATSEQSRVDRVVGTAAFMSPEQGMGHEPTPASDLYSVGVMLFQGLTGKLPFEGTLTDVLVDKQTREAAAPGEIVDGVPQLLDDLCRDLLRRDPTERPTAHDCLVRLGADTTAIAADRGATARNRLEGREVERQLLEDAWSDARRGRLVTVRVRGASGIGKTSLIRHFLAELRKHDSVSVLSGRCFERESVRFKAFDSLMDGLRRRLQRMDAEDRAQLLPADAHLLARLFPALGSVVDVDGEVPVDPVEIRRRAFTAFAGLVLMLSRSRPVVLFLDDVQWGDTDSARLLLAVLRQLDGCRCLVLLAHRTEDADASEFLSAFLHDPATDDLDIRNLELSELPLHRATAVARSLLGDAHADPAETAVWIARESSGNPFLMQELASFAEDATQAELSGLGLDDLFRHRAAAMTPDARSVLTVVAIAGRPLPLGVVAKASAVGDILPPISQLRASHLVRTTRGPLGDLVECYHSRVGEAVVSGLSPEDSAAAHLALVNAMEALRFTDPETLMHHHEAAGNTDKAATLAMGAARAAADSMAFAKAAALFDHALALRTWEEDEHESLLIELGDALAFGGRGQEAARAWLRAADLAESATGFELRRRAAEQLIYNGHLEEGTVHLEAVLDAIGLRLPQRPRGAMIPLLWGRLRIAWWWFRNRDTDLEALVHDDANPADLQRLEVFGFVALVFSVIHPVQGALFHARSLLLAIRCGDRRHLVRTMALEAVTWGLRGRGIDDTATLIRRTHRLAQATGRPELLGLAWLGEGVTAYVEARFRSARRACTKAERSFAAVPNHPFEISIATMFGLRALVYLGELEEARRQRRAALNEAERRGNRLLSTVLRSDVFVLLHLASDDVDAARLETESALADWGGAVGTMPRFYAARAKVELRLYENRAVDALDELERCIAEARAAGMANSGLARFAITDLTGRVALLLASVDARRATRHLASARAAAGRLQHRSRTNALASGLGDVILAGVTASSGNRAGAVPFYESAFAHFGAGELELHAAVVAHRIGTLLPGGDGRKYRKHARSFFEEQKVAQPDRLTQALCPGIPRDSALSIWVTPVIAPGRRDR